MNVVRVIMVSPTATFNNEFEGAAGSPAYLRTGSDGVASVCVSAVSLFSPDLAPGPHPVPALQTPASGQPGAGAGGAAPDLPAEAHCSLMLLIVTTQIA